MPSVLARTLAANAKPPSSGYAAFANAIAPVTCGEDMDVPDKYAYPLFRKVDTMEEPGAPISTVLIPKSDVPESRSAQSVFATVIMLGD